MRRTSNSFPFELVFSAHHVLESYPHPNKGLDWSHDGSILMTLHNVRTMKKKVRPTEKLSFQPSSVHMYTYLAIGDEITTSNLMQVELNDEVLLWCKRLNFDR